MTCTCGAALPEGAKFCGACGATIASPAPAQPPAPAWQEPPQPAYQEPVCQEPVYQEPAQPVYQQPVYQEPVYQQPMYQQPVYQQPMYQQPAAEAPPPKGSRYAPVSAGGFFGYYILFALPIIGLVMSIVWAKDTEGSINRQNLAKLMLVLKIIGIVFLVLMAIFGAVYWNQFAGLFQEAMNGMQEYYP